jgi:phosphoribosylformylglycinamidine cyclo-ligase
MPSNGLHTNGYSLARKVLPRSHKINTELLRVHKNYQPLLAKAPAGMIKGLAHITGGGLIDNLPRVLPKNCDAIVDTKSWRVPQIFKTIQQNGNVDRREIFRVFNMGIGMVAIVAAREAKRAMSILRAKKIGQIERGTGKTKLIF